MIDDPAEALDILLEELKRQKAAGLRRVSISDESLATLKALAGAAPSAPAAASAPVSPAASAARPSAPVAAVRPAAAPVAPKPAVVTTTPVIADAPIFTLPAGTKAERMAALRQRIHHDAGLQRVDREQDGQGQRRHHQRARDGLRGLAAHRAGAGRGVRRGAEGD